MLNIRTARFDATAFANATQCLQNHLTEIKEAIRVHCANQGLEGKSLFKPGEPNTVVNLHKRTLAAQWAANQYISECTASHFTPNQLEDVFYSWIKDIVSYQSRRKMLLLQRICKITRP
jgi:hypothetical protein